MDHILITIVLALSFYSSLLKCGISVVLSRPRVEDVLFIFFFKKINLFLMRIITLQNCVGFCCRLT